MFNLSGIMSGIVLVHWCSSFLVRALALLSRSCLLSLSDKTPQIIFGTSSPFGHPTSSSLADLAVPPLVRVEAFIGVGLNDIY